MLDKRTRQFLEGDYQDGSYHAILKRYLQKQINRGLSLSTVNRHFYNLYPIEMSNPQIGTFTRSQLKKYVNQLRIRYATDTLRTTIGDIRQFFKWCKKVGVTRRNLAKPIKPIRRRIQRRTKAKAPPEQNILTVMKAKATPLIEAGLIYKNVFGMLQTDTSEWSYPEIIRLRDLLIVTFVYETGARGGELAQLGSKQMDTATAKPAPIYLVTAFGKTNDQDYYFTDATAELWRIWQQVRPEEGREFAIISWRRGCCPTRAKTDTISKMLVRSCGRANINAFRSHSLRHAKTKRSRKLIGIELTSFLIGHADIDTTVGYDFIDDEELVEAVKKTGLQADIWKKNGRKSD